MGRLLMFVFGCFALLYYFAFGGGSYGKTAFGTAVAFTDSITSPKCAERMEKYFPSTPGAAALCTDVYASALRRANRTMIAEENDSLATAYCFYGST